MQPHMATGVWPDLAFYGLPQSSTDSNIEGTGIYASMDLCVNITHQDWFLKFLIL